MKIQTNGAANSALGYMRVNSQATERSIQRLSSGFRINRSADDAAGLAIANKLRSDSRALQQASRNAAQATAMLQIADGATQTVGTILDRMKELATQANSSNIGVERGKLQSEFSQLVSEVDRIVSTTQYQGVGLIGGDFGVKQTGGTANAAAGVDSLSLTGAKAGTYTFADPTGADTNITLTRDDGVSQTISGAVAGTGSMTFSALGLTVKTNSNFTIGTGGAAGSLDTLTLTLTATTSASFQVSSSGQYATNDLVSLTAVDLRATQATGLNLNQSLAGGGTVGSVLSDTGTNGDANRAQLLSNIDAAIGVVNNAIGSLGAAQNRIDYATQNVNTLVQNVQAAESTIRDADMALEMTQFTKSNILSQAAQSMLSQANQGTQGILQLLRG
jgi:flagellin